MLLTDPRFSAEIDLTVPFHDVDAMGVVWHGHYLRYMEIAREALLNQFNYGYRQMEASGYLWPVVDARVKYRAPLTFEQPVRVQARVEEYERTACASATAFLTGRAVTKPPPATPSRSRWSARAVNSVLSVRGSCCTVWG